MYYGYRYYAGVNGRWLSRDPIGRAGGANLHVMRENQVVGGIDILGLAADVRRGQPAQQYFDDWIAQFPEETFSDEQCQLLRRTMRAGCIGIVRLNMGLIGGLPDLSNCYSTDAQAVKRQKEMEDNCECAGHRGPGGRRSHPRLFAVQFKRGDWESPMPRSGRVDTHEWRRHLGEAWNFLLRDEQRKRWVATRGPNEDIGFVTHREAESVQNDNEVMFCVACEQFEGF